MPFGPNALETQPWVFGWPSFRSNLPLASTPCSVLDPVSSLTPKPVPAYPLIKICEFPLILDIVWESQLIMTPLDPSVYPFFDLYPTVEQYISVRPPKPVPRGMPLTTPNECTRAKFSCSAKKICKRFPSHLRTLVTSPCRRSVSSLGHLPEGHSRYDSLRVLARGLPNVQYL